MCIGLMLLRERRKATQGYFWGTSFYNRAFLISRSSYEVGSNSCTQLNKKCIRINWGVWTGMERLDDEQNKLLVASRIVVRMENWSKYMHHLAVMRYQQ